MSLLRVDTESRLNTEANHLKITLKTVLTEQIKRPDWEARFVCCAGNSVLSIVSF